MYFTLANYLEIACEFEVEESRIGPTVCTHHCKAGKYFAPTEL